MLYTSSPRGGGWTFRLVPNRAYALQMSSGAVAASARLRDAIIGGLPHCWSSLGLGAFLVYANWAAFQNAHYTFGPYISPFYSPELFGDSPHAMFGPKPSWYPAFLPFSPALLILWIPGLFRLTCYYYRGAYYKSFWADPPACAVGEPRKSYLGRTQLSADSPESSPLFPAALLSRLGISGL